MHNLVFNFCTKYHPFNRMLTLLHHHQGQPGIKSLMYEVRLVPSKTKIATKSVNLYELHHRLNYKIISACSKISITWGDIRHIRCDIISIDIKPQILIISVEIITRRP